MWRGDLCDRSQLFLTPSCGGVAEGRGGFAFLRLSPLESFTMGCSRWGRRAACLEPEGGSDGAGVFAGFTKTSVSGV